MHQSTNQIKAPSARMKPRRNQSTLVDVTFRFASLNNPTHKEISLYKEQFYTLVLNTNSKDRRSIAKQLANTVYAPKAIIIFLALEEIAIAQLPLEHSPLLQPADLNLIIEKSKFEKALIIARRNNLDSTNVIALLRQDNEAGEIQDTLRANKALNRNMEILKALSKAKNNTQWQEEKADNIVHVSAEKLAPTPPLKASRDLSGELLNLANKGGRLRKKPIGKPVKTAASAITLQEIETKLLDTIRKQEVLEFSMAIQSFCGLNNQITFRILEEHNAGMLATLLKALQVSDVTAARILLMANRDIGRNAYIFKTVSEKYLNLDLQECITFFTKMGADFTHTHFKKEDHIPTTRYALSLAARARRSALLSAQEKSLGSEDFTEATRLSA